MPNINGTKSKKSFWKKLTGDVEAEETEEQEQPRHAVESQVAETERIEVVQSKSAEATTTAKESQSEAQAEGWMNDEYEGQLSVDVYQTADDIVIKSTIAGVKPEDIDISIQNDMITIRGQRHQEERIKEGDYFYQECYWGGFSRSIILPTEVRSDKIEAVLKDGILKIVLPKIKKTKSVVVKVKREI